ncbi:MAG: UDP-N-acetylglucosamine 1-carboxyvinyltransferase [Firmicutes bacterium]|nr:UDP-N-acetylglucosamine 1-carboxyvinyltransferase [Bacillota bacterium]
MDRLVIKGKAKLEGKIPVSGAKNAALPIMAATILTESECILHGIPDLTDIFVMAEVLQLLGVKVHRVGDSLMINAQGMRNNEVSEKLMRKMRASNLVMGALLGRSGRFRVSYPGGCAIGSRPMDLHLKGFRELGVKIDEKFGYIEGEAPKLRGAEIHLDFPSVGATENLMMAACLAEGTTMIRNAAKEPEIVDLQNFLNTLGARIIGAGLDVIRIDGVRKLGGGEHRIIPDRIEAGTHMVAAAITQGDVVVTNVVTEHVEPVVAKLREAGVTITEEAGGIRVKGRRPRAVDVKTLPFPGFPTDMQPQMMALMTIAEGTGLFTETIFENRFKHVNELRRMGANIKVEGHVAVVKGINHLCGALVEATDLRAGAALVIAGLAAENTTIVEGVEHIDRGYERLEEKYRAVGADITRVSVS